MGDSTGLLSFAIQNGVAGVLLIILYLFTKHHLDVLNKHHIETERVHKEKEALERELRQKIEELLKDQINSTQPITEALLESSKVMGYVRSQNERVANYLKELNKDG